jgi:hypothetical protein
VSKQHLYPVAVWVVLALVLLSINTGCSGPWVKPTPTPVPTPTPAAEAMAANQSLKIVWPLNGSLVTQSEEVTVRVEAQGPQVGAAGTGGIDHFKLFYKKKTVEQTGVSSQVNAFVQADALLVQGAEVSAQGVSAYQGELYWIPPEPGSQTVTVWAYDQEGKRIIGPVSVLLNVMPSPPAAEWPTPTPRPPCSNNALVETVNLIEGCCVRSGEKIDFTWRVKNTGSCDWDSRYKLVFVGGDRMEIAAEFVMPEVISAEGQETVDFPAHLRAPEASGIYEGFWRMEGPDGVRFGNEAHVYIEIPLPTPTPIPTVTPGPRPEIHSFTANPATVAQGQSSTLNWEVVGADQIYLYPGGEGGVPAVGSRTVYPTSTTTYRLTAVKAGNWEERQLTVSLALPDLLVEDVGLTAYNYIRFRVRNVGQGNVNQTFRVHVEKSGVGIWDQDVHGLSAGQSLSFEVDREPVVGREWVRVVADSQHVIEEANKNDNERSVELGTNPRVTVDFTRSIIHDNGTPEDNAEIAFRFRVNGQEIRYPVSGYIPDVTDDYTLLLSEQITIYELSTEQNLDVLVQGLLCAEGGETLLGEVHFTYQYADDHWQAGQHIEPSSGGDGSFTIYYNISVQ